MTEDDGSQLHQRAPLLHSEELYSNRRVHRNVSSFAHNHRRQRNMTWNRSKWLFWRLAVAISMIAVAAEHSETAPVDRDLEQELEEFFYAVESSDQSFGDSSHLEKDRSLQNFGQPQIIPTPFSFPPIPPIIIQFGKPSRTGKENLFFE
jgi:hypothetical protein